MKVTAPFEPALCAHDFDRMLRFYTEVLGMSVFSIDDIGESASVAARLSPGAYRIARLETQGGDRLKLVAPKHPPQSQPARQWAMERGGFAYLTFIVPDLHAVMVALKAAGMTFPTGEQPVAFRAGVELFFACDPEGNCLEFVQRNDLATYRPTAPAKD
jgi:lactoylglutathione lyase